MALLGTHAGWLQAASCQLALRARGGPHAHASMQACPGKHLAWSRPQHSGSRHPVHGLAFWHKGCNGSSAGEQDANSFDWDQQKEIPLLPPGAWDDAEPAEPRPFWECMCPNPSCVRPCVEQVCEGRHCGPC